MEFNMASECDYGATSYRFKKLTNTTAALTYLADSFSAAPRPIHGPQTFSYATM